MARANSDTIIASGLLMLMPMLMLLLMMKKRADLITGPDEILTEYAMIAPKLLGTVK